MKNYTFDGNISREVLENYLSRAVTAAGLYDSKTLEVRIILSGTYTLASIKINGKEDPKFIRDYSSPKRAISVIQSTVRRAGYEW